MISPPFLSEGNKIGIIATARKVSPVEMNSAIEIIESWGLKVELGKHLYETDRQFAGDDDQRASDLQQMLDDPEIKAIFCARGGYGTVRIIDHLEFTGFVKNPKWIVGYSDITVLHSHIHQHFGIETLHATMPLNFPTDGNLSSSVSALKHVLFGESPEYKVQTTSLSRNGSATGVVIGGNLSILFSLIGSSSDIDTDGKILFLEDLDEYLYHIDRMMMNLKRSGKLERLSGLVIGGMSEMKDNTVPFGKTAEEIIAGAVKDFKYPVLFGFPAGHQDENLPLIIGREATLDVGEVSSLTFHSKPLSGKGKKSLLLKPLIFITCFFVILYLLYALITGNM